MSGEGTAEMQAFAEAGFSSEEIADWRSQTQGEFIEAGFTADEINDYFGVPPEPDMRSFTQRVKDNLTSWEWADLSNSDTPEIDSVAEAIQAGFGVSATSLIVKGKPGQLLPEDAPSFLSIAQQVGTLAGDLPLMIPGGFLGGIAGTVGGGLAGGAAGSVAPGLGTTAGVALGGLAGSVAGTGAGGFAAPEFIRSALMDYYENGGHTFKDFWPRASGILLNTMKAGVVGAATNVVGGVTGAALLKAGAKPAIQAAGTLASEIGTMVTVGKALEGELGHIRAQDFLEAAAVVAVLKGGLRAGGITARAPAKLTKHIASKMRGVFAKTGMAPQAQLNEIVRDPVLGQEYVAENIDAPRAAEISPRRAEPTEHPRPEMPDLSPALSETPTVVRAQGEAARVSEVTGGEPMAIEVEPMSRRLARDLQDGLQERLVREGEIPAEITGDHGSYQTFEKLIVEGGREVGFVTGQVSKAGEGGARTIRIAVAELTPEAQGKKLAVEGARQLADWALRTGGELQTDATVTEAAARVIQALGRRGYTVEQNPEAVLTNGTWKAPGMGDWVFRIKEGPDTIRITDFSNPGGGPLPGGASPPGGGGAGAPPADGAPAGGGTPPPRPRPSLAEADAAVQGRIAPHPKAKWGIDWNKFYTRFVDDLHPIKLLVKALGEGTVPSQIVEDAYTLARLTRGNFGKADHMLKFAMLDFKTLEPIRGRAGDSFITIEKEAIGEFDPMFPELQEKTAGEFWSYVMSERVIEVMERVERARIAAGESPDMRAGDRFTLPRNFTIDNRPASGLAEILSIHHDITGSWVRASVRFEGALRVIEAPFELARSRLWADVGGKLVKNVATGVDRDAAHVIIGARSARFRQYHERLVEYQNGLARYLRDAGIIGEEAYLAMEEAHRAFVPMYRLLEGAEGAPRESMAPGLQVHNPLEKLTGDESFIVDPRESVIKNTYLYTSLAERNRVLSTLVEQAAHSPVGAELVKLVEAEVRPVTITEAEVARFFEDHGIEAAAAPFTVFRRGAVRMGPHDFLVFKDGKARLYEVDPEVAGAIKALDYESINFITKVAAIPASMLRAGSVLNPDFMVRNILRDTMQLFVTTTANPAQAILGGFSGAKSLIFKDAKFQEWLRSGGVNSSMMEIDKQYLQMDVWKLNKQTGFINSAWNVVKSPFELSYLTLRATSEFIESSTRLGEFKRVTEGKQGIEALLEGGYASREATLDFMRSGSKTRALNMIAAFFNAHVQGLDKIRRALVGEPGMTMAQRLKGAARTLTKATIAITVPSVLLWMNNRNDPRWKKLPQWQKDLFWIYFRDDGVIVRIPKPHELGLIFGSAAERALEGYFDQNPDSFKDFEETILRGFVPDASPTIGVPIIEHWANRSKFRDTPVVRSDVEDRLYPYQYTEYTTETAKAIGKLIPQLPLIGDSLRDRTISSPSVIENYIRGWTGGLGGYVMQLADQALITSGIVEDPVKPTMQLADYPFVKAFVIRYPSAAAPTIVEFSERYEKSQRFWNTVRDLARSGDYNSVQEVFTLDQYRDRLVMLRGTERALASHRRLVRMIANNRGFTPDDKRQMIDGLYYKMIEMAEVGNAMLDEVKKGMKGDGE